MALTLMRFEFLPFCYRHNVEMKPDQTLPATEKEPAQPITFACPRAGCFVRYNSSNGYLVLTQDASGDWAGEDLGPLVRCEKDRAPMYLSEFLTERRNLRLWKCPICKTVRANAEVSVA